MQNVSLPTKQTPQKHLKWLWVGDNNNNNYGKDKTTGFLVAQKKKKAGALEEEEEDANGVACKQTPRNVVKLSVLWLH